MLLCVSLNPAIDKRLVLHELRVGQVNRAVEAVAAPGGKAAHVAMVLRTLGADPVWLGFAGGATGAALLNGLRALSIRTESIPVAGSTRTNLELVHAGEVTEILEPGHVVTPSELQQCEDRFGRLLATSPQSIVILSGSLPGGVPPDFYARLVRVTHEFRGRAFVDSSGEPLKLALAAKPDFVKPNQQEAEAWSGRKIESARPAEATLAQLLEAGALAGAISLGERGLVCAAAKQKGATLFAKGPALKPRSTVGSGDSSLAGFAFGAAHGFSPAESARLAAACGAANCLAEGPGLARAEDIERLKREIQVETLQ